jgi:hypothetical protein
MTNLRNLLLTIAALAVLPGSIAQAANLSISFDFSNLLIAPGQTVTFSGTITNLESVTVDLNGCDVNLPGPFTTDCGLFLANAPFFLNAHQTSASFGMFSVTAGVTYPGPYGLRPGGIFTVLGGLEAGGVYDPSTQHILSQSTFAVTVAPEPGTAALLCLALPLAFALRRRSISHRRSRLRRDS